MSIYQGILVQDSRVSADSIDATLTTADQAGVKVGLAVPSSPTRMILAPSGPIAADESIQIDTIRGGYPGRDWRAGGFTYSRDAGTTTFWWDLPNAISQWEFLNFRNSSATDEDDYDQFEPSLLKLPDGRVLLAVKEDQGADFAIRVSRFDPDDGSWTSIAVLSDAVITDFVLRPTMLATHDGQIQLYHFVDVDAGGDEMQVALWTSRDDGETWVLESGAVLTSSIAEGSDPSLMKVAQAENGQVGLLMRAAGALIWYGAASPGARFERVSVNAGFFDDPLGVSLHPEPGGGFRLYAHAAGDADKIRTRVFADAFAVDEQHLYWDTISTADQIELLPDFDVWVGDDGASYLNVVALGTTTPAHIVYRSENGVDFDASAGVVQGYWLHTESEDYTGDPTYIGERSTVETRGLTITVGVLHSEVGAADVGSIVCVYSGGHTTQTMPPSSAEDVTVGRRSWLRTYLGVGSPTDYEWTGSGTATETPSSRGWNVECTSGQTRSFACSDASLGEGDREVIVEISGSDLDCNISSSTRMGLQVVHQGATLQYGIGINMIDAGFAIEDLVDGTYSSTFTLDMTEPWTIRVALYESRFAVWFRSNADPVEREWTLASSGTGLTSAAVTSANEVGIAWGSFDTGAATHSMTVSRVAYTLTPAGYLTDTGALELPLNPRPFSRLPLPLGSGTAISAISGPTEAGDQWTIGAEFRYGFDELFEPNPRSEWRSTTDSSSVDIVWDLTGFGDDVQPLVSSLGLMLKRINFRQFSLVGIPDGGVGIAEQTLLTCYASPYAPDAGTLAYDYERTGSVVSCPSSNTRAETYWVGHNDLVGGWVQDVTSGITLPIVGNSSGVWTDDTAQKKLRIQVSGDASTLGNTGVCQIILPEVAAYHLAADLVDTYRYLKLSIPAQDTAEGYFRIGRLMLGPLYVFGVPPDWARSREIESNIDLFTGRSGGRVAYRRGQPRRIETIRWASGIDESELQSANPSTKVFSGKVLAVPGDTARLTEGLFRALEGALEPCTYFSTLSTSPGAATVTRRRAWLYGRITSQYSSDVIVGAEESTELVRGGEFRLEEEIG